MKQLFTKLVTREFSVGMSPGRPVTYVLDVLDGRDQWGLLGGRMLATHDMAPPSDTFSHAIHLNFHGGKNCWHVEREKWSRSTTYPREDHYGSLKNMMAKFEELSGQTLEEVTWCELGAGISHVSARGVRGGTLADPRNPWELQEGAIYSVDQAKRNESPRVTQYRAVLVGKGPIRYMELKPVKHPADYPETFDPSLIMESLILNGGRAQMKLVEPSVASPAEECATLEDAQEPAPSPSP